MTDSTPIHNNIKRNRLASSILLCIGVLLVIVHIACYFVLFAKPDSSGDSGKYRLCNRLPMSLVGEMCFQNINYVFATNYSLFTIFILKSCLVLKIKKKPMNAKVLKQTVFYSRKEVVSSCQP